MEYKAITEDDPRGELLHYGVLGMKWGVHRARKAVQSGDSTKSKAIASKHYAKAEAKLNKYDARYNKQAAKAKKQIVKAEAYKYGPFGGHQKKYRKAKAKADRSYYKATKQMKRGIKWYNKMEKNFASTGVHNLSTNTIDVGRKFIDNMTKFQETLIGNSHYV